MYKTFEKIEPAFQNCKHCIVFCANDNYMALTSVAVQSIVEQSDPEGWYDILILHAGVNREHQKAYLDHWKNISNLSLRFVDVSFFFDGLNLFTENRKSISRETYFRIVIPWVLSDRYEKALYLDGDMIVRHDISEIFRTEIDNYYFAAVRDYWGICVCYIPGHRRKNYRISIGLEDIDSYVIAATQLLNLKMWREQFDLEKVLDFCVSKEWEQHDQDVINVLCKGRIKLIPPVWGMMEDYGYNHYLPAYLQEELMECENDPTIVHFGGPWKPYEKKYLNYDIEFWNYAEHTPYMADLFSRISSSEYRSYVAMVINNGRIQLRDTGKEQIGLFKGVIIQEPYMGDRCYTRTLMKKETFHVEGWVRYFEPYKEITSSPVLIVNGKTWKPSVKTVAKEDNRRLVIPRFICRFEFEVPLDNTERQKTIRLGFSFGKNYICLKNIRFQSFTAISGRYKSDYYSDNGWILKTDKERSILLLKRTQFGTVLNSEGAFLAELVRSERQSDRKAAAARCAAHIARFFIRKPVWLVSDRLDKADDNGEIFYRYLKKYHSKEIDSYFLISASAPNYNDIKKLGGVIEPYSWKHKILALIADWSLSSQTDLVFRHPFWNYEHPYRNMLVKTKFVFLQHGVLTTDMTRWLRKDVQQFDGFVTSTEAETKRVLEGDYGYTEEQVWMTGLPRFDRLHNKKRSKLITVMPAWRKQLTTKQDTKTGKWGVKPGFSESAYAAFYRELMHSQELKATAEKYGYTIQMKIHPNFAHLADDFRFEDWVKVVPADVSYSEIFSSSSLLITDYSSSVQDFIYLEKPVVYCQFDADYFFSGEDISDKGDIDFQKEGFGEVTYSLEELVTVVVSYIKCGCELREPYKTRIRNAFPDRTPDHCEKLYQKILETEAEHN